MKPLDVDPNEQAFVATALAAAARAQRWDQVRVTVTTVAAFAAAGWFAFRPPSPELRIEATILVVSGAMLAAVSAKIRSQIQRNTNLILHVLAGRGPKTRD
jgi:hypothetical protein